MSRLAALRRGPVLLRADNFTPPSRTPWGGHVLGRTVKREVAGAAGATIGESWDFSCDPAFPSKLVEGLVEGLVGGGDLAGLVRDEPEAVLSPAAVRAGRTTIEILVKLVDAAEPLSLQVHPADDDANLKAGECGKPESWLVLDAAPGAGLFLGFAAPLSRDELRRALADGDRAKALLQFVPVRPGDYFEIEPGVPHAIGAGITLLEPQRVLAGKSGKTFRMWDWGRRYDAAGRPDPRGAARELHVEQSLALVDPSRQVGMPFVDGLRRSPRHVTRTGLEARVYPANSYAQTTLVKLARGAELSLAVKDGYAALIMLNGATRCGDLRLGAGQPALVPHAAFPVTLRAETDCELAVVTPNASPLSF